MHWLKTLRARYGFRTTLTPEELLRLFALPAPLGLNELTRILRVFQEEYGVAIGQLRPTDPLEWFSTPPEAKNPTAWLFARAAYEDRLSELNYQIKTGRAKSGQSAQRGPRVIIRDYVLACSGK